MPGPFPYSPLQYNEQQTLLFSGPERIGIRELWQIKSRLPQFFATGTNKGAASFWMGAAIARHPSGTGFVLASNAAAGTTTIGLACLGAPAGQPEIVQLDGLFNLDNWTPVTGSAALTPLGYYYLDATSGRLITTPPAAPALTQLVGLAISPNTLNLSIVPPVTGGGLGYVAYGQFYVEGNAVAQTLANQNQYYIINPTWLAGLSSGMTPDVGNSRIIVQVSGVYQILVSIDYSGPVNHEFQFAIFENGIFQALLTTHSVPRGNNQTVFTAIGGLNQLAVGDLLDLRVQCTTGAGQSITVVHANVGLIRLAGT